MLRLEIRTWAGCDYAREMNKLAQGIIKVKKMYVFLRRRLFTLNMFINLQVEE
jgi:hypothetical protein